MLPPLRFTPLIKRLRWGGTRLGRLLGKPIGSAIDAAESWEIADHGIDQTQVAGGPFAGWTINQVMNEFGGELLGNNSKQTVFPLLVKFLDAHDRLSLQVHPSDMQAKALAGAERGKTEAWVILDALPGSLVYAGLKPGMDRTVLESAIQGGTLSDCVHAFQAQPGDCFLIPAGTIHAVGEGILLAEIQQTSDVTFRLHDWGRLGSDGRPRQLHVEQALKCLDFSRGPVNPIQPRIVQGISDNRVEELVTSEHFVIRRHTGSHDWQLEPTGGFRILMLIKGDAELAWLEGVESLTVGDTILIPATCPNCRLVPHGECLMLETYLPSQAGVRCTSTPGRSEVR